MKLDAIFQKGSDTPTYVIAEAGVNHNGSVELARQLIDGALAAGADAVKFQLFDPETLVSESAQMAQYQVDNLASDAPENHSQKAMLAKLALSRESFKELQAYAGEKGILFLCSPFDEGSARFLVEEMALPVLKIPSGELTNLPYLATLAAMKTPLILSTGMATLVEVEAAVSVVRQNGNPPLALLHCVSAYPTPAGSVNLRAMETLQQAFPETVIGYSDHTMGWHIPVAAVARGARIIEKHFTLDKAMPGPDHKASLEVPELAAMMREIRDVETALGDGVKAPQPIELDCRQAARKSLVLICDLPLGHVLTREDLTVKRPGTGLSPALLDRVIGAQLTCEARKDDVLTDAMLSGLLV